MWLIKVKESQQFQFFFLPLMLLIFKLLLFVPQGEDLSFFYFVRGTNLFSVSKFTCSPKKESEKLKNSHFGQIHVQFVLFTVSYWVSAIYEHSLWIHISQLSHRTALWPFRTAPLQRPQSALHFVQYQTSSPDSILKSSLSPRFEHEAWKRFSHSSHSRSLSDALQYFLHKPHWNLGPGFISISPTRMIRINKFVPLWGLEATKSLRTSSLFPGNKVFFLFFFFLNEGNRGTKAYLGNREHRKSRFWFWGTKAQSNLFHGGKRQVPPVRASVLRTYSQIVFLHLQIRD